MIITVASGTSTHDLDHRRGDQDRQRPSAKAAIVVSRSAPLKAAVQQSDLARKASTEQAEAFLGIGEVDFPDSSISGQTQ